MKSNTVFIIILVVVFVLLLTVKHSRSDTNSVSTLSDTEKAGTLTERTINGVKFTFVQIPGGSFQMGSNDGRDFERPVHQVTIQPFKMQTTEVTQAQWIAIMGTNYSNMKGDNLPVEGVKWKEAQAFVTKLNQLDPGKGYRLPSESEWEYACRAGTTTKYYNGDSESDLAQAGWYRGNSNSKTHPVGQKMPNKWGLYDMLGNILEWCDDDGHDNYAGAPSNGQSWIHTPRGFGRVLRGGDFGDMISFCRSTSRIPNYPATWLTFFGFRIACQ